MAKKDEQPKIPNWSIHVKKGSLITESRLIMLTEGDSISTADQSRK